MQNTFFSIIVPVYNTEPYLQECVDSVLIQTYTRYELILINDGSTDNSPSICDSYALKNPKVKVVHKKNGGASSARNAGIDAAQGDYVIFLDSDDYWDDVNALAELNEICIQENIDVIVWHNKDLENSTSEISPIHNLPILDNIIKKSQLEVLKALCESGAYGASSAMKAVKTDIIKRNNIYFEEGIITSEDHEWCALVAIYANSFAFYDKAFYIRRIRAESATNTFSEKRITDFIEQALKVCDIAHNVQDTHLRDALLTYAKAFYWSAIVIANDYGYLKQYYPEIIKYQYIFERFNNDKSWEKRNKIIKLFGLRFLMRLLKIKMCLEKTIMKNETIYQGCRKVYNSLKCCK